jgi:hypothetical protein
MHPIAIAVLILVGIEMVAIAVLLWMNLSDIDEKRYGGRDGA